MSEEVERAMKNLRNFMFERVYNNRQAKGEEEKAEQAVLRREYIDSFKRSLTGQLDNMYIVDEKGNKTKVERKGKKK